MAKLALSSADDTDSRRLQTREGASARIGGICSRPVLALLVLALLLAFLAPLPARAQDAPPAPSQTIPDTYKQLAENDAFKLYANPDTLAFKVGDKRNGYVWSSNLDEKAAVDRLNKTWTAFASSGISINYLDDKAQSKRVSLTNGKHSTDFRTIDGGFEASVRFDDASITLLVRVVLEPSGVRVEAPFASIRQEDPAFKLGVLHLYPWLGATRTDAIPGYMFIPDGSGGLVQFSAETKARNMLYGRYYGIDIGMIGEVPWTASTIPAYNLSLPVIGMAHGAATGGASPLPVEQRNAFISVIEKGAGYGEIQMHPAGVTTNFNFIYNAFIYNESYFQPTNRAGAGVTALQRQTNNFDVVIHHRFLTGAAADYVGMARSYQRYLVEHGDLSGPAAAASRPDRSSGGDIGIRLEFLAGESEKVLFFNRPIPITTVSQMGDIVKGLTQGALAVRNAQIVYYGWQPFGASTQPPVGLKLDGSLGSVQQLRAVSEQVTATGGRFYLYTDPQAALIDQGGYSPRRDLAMSIADSALTGDLRYMGTHYLNLPAVSSRYAALSRDVSSRLQGALAVEGVGTMLYSDFRRENFLNRENTIEAYRKLLAETSKAYGKAAFYRPNDYAFSAMDAYFDAPLTGSGYIYVSESVPFLQVVLAGHVPYYGPALNFSSNTQNDLLRMADYGVYPSYYLTYEPTSTFLNTPSLWMYTSHYQQWAPEAERTYAWLNKVLGPVQGQPIVAREGLSDRVTVTTYANGKRVLVNYGDQPATLAGTTIPARDAVVVEAQP